MKEKFHSSVAFKTVSLVSVLFILAWIIAPNLYQQIRIALAVDVLQTVEILPADDSSDDSSSSKSEQFTENNFITPEPTVEDESFLFDFAIKAAPEYRDSLDIPAKIFFRRDNNLEIVDADLQFNDQGLANFEAELPEGDYDIAVNGISHLTKILYGVTLSQTQSDYFLDYTITPPQELIAGDAVDDNIIISTDIAQVLQTYKSLITPGIPSSSDFTGDDQINSLDVAILLQNYREQGDQ